MLHFAYGSNMSRSMMAVRCREAQPLGVATVAGWRFVINRQGYGTLVACRGKRVHGVLWHLSARDLAALNAYENVDKGLYRRRNLPLHYGGKQTVALVYLTRIGGHGIPAPAYIQLVLRAAAEWDLPDTYIASLRRCSRSAWQGTRAMDTGEVGWR
ncbi:MAG: gamma-glutamylcyclotransferase family protein [Xanthobacteraceae bacterium]